ncbi:MAG: response regulator transcription factor [Gammaproteobacteria bacterium]|nr:response regulator transcription factor [Gammaproteobacteria bacterium]
MRVLVVEDDGEVARQLASGLRAAGYAVDVAHDGEEGHFLGDTESYDAVVLDLGLPRTDGLAVLTRWRSAGRTFPVLILTARDTWREKVTGLRAGADDYVAKPFEIEEVIARLEALIRRASRQAHPLLTCGEVTLDPATRRVTMEGQPVELTALEYRTLSYLMHHPGAIVSKTELTEHIYEQDFDRDSNVVEVLINRLRNKLRRDLIKTHRGRGYELARSDESH